LFGKQTIIDKAKQILDQLSRFVAAVPRTESELGAAEAELVNAEAQLAQQEALAAIGEPAELEASRSTLQAIREKANGLRLRRSALTAAVRVHEDALLGIEEELAAAGAEALEPRRRAWISELTKRASALRETLLKGEALAELTGWSLPRELAAGGLFLRDAENLSQNVFDLDPIAVRVEGGLEMRAAWASDPAVAKFGAEVAREYSTVRAATEALKVIHRRRDQEDREAVAKEAIRA
jgi:hypothetical protein